MVRRGRKSSLLEIEGKGTHTPCCSSFLISFRRPLHLGNSHNELCDEVGETHLNIKRIKLALFPQLLPRLLLLSCLEILGTRCHFADTGFPSGYAWWFGTRSEREAWPCKAKKDAEGLKGWERKAKLMLSVQVWTCMFCILASGELMCSGLMRQLIISRRSHAYQAQFFPELGCAKSHYLVEVVHLSEDSGCGWLAILWMGEMLRKQTLKEWNDLCRLTQWVCVCRRVQHLGAYAPVVSLMHLIF